MAGFSVQISELVPPAVMFLPEVREADELWPPPGTPEPNLKARGMTEARCVIHFFNGRTTDEKLDELKHLANICVIKTGGGYWSPQPIYGRLHSEQGLGELRPEPPALTKRGHQEVVHAKSRRTH